MNAIEAINALRASEGKGALAESAPLVAAAAAHSKYMVRFGLAHNEYLLLSPFRRMISAGYIPLSAGGECIAEGQQTAEEVVEAWAGHPPHRAILLGPYVHIGVSRQGDFWTADFASGMGVEPPPPAPNHADWRPF